MSVVDTMAGDVPGQHDEIAQRGRQEAQRGMDDMHNTRQPEHTQYPTSGLRETTSVAGTGASMREPPPTSAAAHHHRDNAISGLPSPQTRELQGRYEDHKGEFRRPQYD